MMHASINTLQGSSWQGMLAKSHEIRINQQAHQVAHSSAKKMDRINNNNKMDMFLFRHLINQFEASIVHETNLMDDTADNQYHVLGLYHIKVIVDFYDSNPQYAQFHANFLMNNICKKVKRNLVTPIYERPTTCWELLSSGDCSPTISTALHYAAAHHQKAEIINFLLEHGANPNTFDSFMKTPLDYALERNHTQLIEILTNHGAV